MLRSALATGVIVTTVAVSLADVPSRLVDPGRMALSPADHAKNLVRETGIQVDVAALGAAPIQLSGNRAPFWTVLQELADKSDSHIETQGGKISLRPGKSLAPTHVSGAFRLVARESSARVDLATGASTVTIQLETTWEPWLNVYRIDSSPTIDKATDDTGAARAVAPRGPRTYASGVAAPLLVRLPNVPRSAKTIDLAGNISATVADELLTFQFPSNGKAPPAQKGIAAELVKSSTDGNDWIVEVTLTYPKGGPIWESYEDYWLRNNVLRAIPATDGPPIVFELDSLDRSIRYIAKGKASAQKTGKWNFDYRTPGPLREETVRFELKQIKLP